MSDDQQPSFFGGLPPRASQQATAQNQPSVNHPRPVDDKKRSKRLIWALVGAFVVVLIGAIVVANMAMAALSDNAAAVEKVELQKEIATSEAEDAAKTDAIIEAGGGAVTGHALSPEMCTALDGFIAAGGDAVASNNTSPELLAATEALAAIESPNQATYESYVGLQKDPTSIKSIADAQALSVQFVRAAQADLVTCQ
jgi:hypothetical protein